VFGYVRTDVTAATAGKQEPGVYAELGGDEIFLMPKAPAKGSDPAGLTPGHTAKVAPPPRPNGAAEAWSAVKDSTLIGELEAIVRRFPGTVYADFANARIEALRKQHTALVKPPKAPEPIVTALDPALSVKPGSGKSFRDRTAEGAPCPECPEMVVVPAGTFTMGATPPEIDALKKGRPSTSFHLFESQGPQRTVTIARPFAVGKFEATFAEWDACVAAGGCTYRPHDGIPGQVGWGRGKQPVINVSWHDITKEYLPWLSRLTGKSYRLLSEAEWEYAARAGTTTPYWWGTSISTSQANYTAHLKDNRDRIVPVDSFAPNPWGLFSVHGNVSEWVQDCRNASYVGAPSDGSPWVTGNCEDRITRGGSFVTAAWPLRSASRSWMRFDIRLFTEGFRVARGLDP
jgi:formylglycine-generating enzyme required for sulfatase activity